jgi:hypothetical protein
LAAREDIRLAWGLQPVDRSIEQRQYALVAGKIIDDDKAAEPASMANKLLDVVRYAFGLTPVVHKIERDAADGAYGAPLVRQSVVPSDRVAMLRTRKYAFGPQPAVRDQRSSADQEKFLQTRRHGLYSSKTIPSRERALATTGTSRNETRNDAIVAASATGGRSAETTPLDGAPDGLSCTVIGDQKPTEGVDLECPPGLVVIATDSPGLHECVHFQGE